MVICRHHLQSAELAIAFQLSQTARPKVSKCLLVVIVTECDQPDWGARHATLVVRVRERARANRQSQNKTSIPASPSATGARHGRKSCCWWWWWSKRRRRRRKKEKVGEGQLRISCRSGFTFFHGQGDVAPLHAERYSRWRFLAEMYCHAVS
jgi:hypothetical protein